MSIFKTIMGITLLTTSLTGEATGKLGRYSSTATEYASWAGKNATALVGDVSYATSQGIDKLGQNDFIKITSNLTHATGDLAYCASNLFEATETVSKNGQTFFQNLEDKSQELRVYATDLLNERKNEYRDLNGDFGFRGKRETSQVDGEDWIDIKEFKRTKMPSRVSKLWIKQVYNQKYHQFLFNNLFTKTF